jgi:hypothetical protein
LQANALIAQPLGHDPIVERHTRRSAADFANFKAASGFIGDIQSLAIAIRCQKNAIGCAGVDGGRKARVQGDLRPATG